MISEQEFNQLLHKYQTGRCTEAELQLIDAYLESRPNISAGEPSEQLIGQTLKRIHSGIDAYQNRSRQRRKMANIVLRIAATFLLFTAAALICYRQRDKVYNYLHPVSYTSVAAKRGQNVTVNLPDGSIVILNQNSRLSYSNRFNEQLREVSLSGEAYFQITKDKAKPFIVHTGKLSTKVLGTSFNIEAYPFSRKIAVELITGKIWLHAEPHKGKAISYILTPNQAVSYDTISGVARKQDVSHAENYIAWKDGKIKFDNTTMEEAVRRLNTTFKSRISLADAALAGQRIYGEFRINEDPVSIISNLCMLTKAKYQTKGGKIIIYPAKHQKPNINAK